MARIDRARLDPRGIKVWTAVPTRFADLDLNFHVNNVAAMSVLQEARVAFNSAAGIKELLGDLRLMVASLTVEYAAEIRHPSTINIGTCVLAIGRSSFTLGQIVVGTERPALYAEAILVTSDTQGPAPMHDSLREALETLRPALI